MPDSKAAEHLQLIANVSILFTEEPYGERFSAAADAGFQGTESWWPFTSAQPGRDELDEFLARVSGSGIPLVSLNLFAGDMSAGERGLVSRPDRRDEFLSNLDVVVEIAAATGCRVFNALYGQRQAALTNDEQDRVAIENLALATQKLETVGGTVLIEPLTTGTAGSYPITTADDAAGVVRAVRDRTGHDNIGLLFDTFHLANNGDDLLQAIDTHRSEIAHVQLADTPGRGEPGSGDLDIPAVIDALWRAGYRGAVSCEYQPTTATESSLGWIGLVPQLALS